MLIFHEDYYKKEKKKQQKKNSQIRVKKRFIVDHKNTLLMAENC